MLNWHALKGALVRPEFKESKFDFPLKICIVIKNPAKKDLKSHLDRHLSLYKKMPLKTPFCTLLSKQLLLFFLLLLERHHDELFFFVGAKKRIKKIKTE